MVELIYGTYIGELFFVIEEFTNVAIPVVEHPVSGNFLGIVGYLAQQRIVVVTVLFQRGNAWRHWLVVFVKDIQSMQDIVLNLADFLDVLADVQSLFLIRGLCFTGQSRQLSPHYFKLVPDAQQKQ
nr:hypothetical protein [Bifidobacterium tissieri]